MKYSTSSRKSNCVEKLLIQQFLIFNTYPHIPVSLLWICWTSSEDLKSLLKAMDWLWLARLHNIQIFYKIIDMQDFCNPKDLSIKHPMKLFWNNSLRIDILKSAKAWNHCTFVSLPISSIDKLLQNMNKITRYLRYKKHYQHTFKYELNKTRNSAPGSKRLFKKKKLYLLSYLFILANLPNKSNHKKLFSQN